jgi:hypothetical protein
VRLVLVRLVPQPALLVRLVPVLVRLVRPHRGAERLALPVLPVLPVLPERLGGVVAVLLARQPLPEPRGEQASGSHRAASARSLR